MMEDFAVQSIQNDRPTLLDQPMQPVAATIPWVEGALLRFFSAEKVLDIKAPGDPDDGPVVAGATVAFFSEVAASMNVVHGSFPAWQAADHSFRTVFSRDALGLAKDPAATLAAWFNLVETDGHLIIILPTAARLPPKDSDVGLAEPAAPPSSEAIIAESSANSVRRAIHQASLMNIVETALPAGTFRVALLNQGLARRSAFDSASHDLRLVLRKLEPAELVAPPETSESIQTSEVAQQVADLSIPFTSIHPNPIKTPGMRSEGGLLVRDFASQVTEVARILILKLDHHGDFIIALPALRELRSNFPSAYLRLVCGRWNVSSALSTGLFDDVRAYDYFPERAMEWTGVPESTNWSVFTAATEGYFDVALDLRVDEDTRSLLGRVDAGLRCGIGSVARFPLLDIALPDSSREPSQIALSPLGNFSLTLDGAQVLQPSDFVSEMDVQTIAYHESAFRSIEMPLLRSAVFFLPEGSYSVSFDLTAHGFIPGPRGVGVKIDVLANGERKIASKVFGRRSIARLDAVSATLRFESSGRPSTYEFMVTTEGRPLAGRLRFAGLTLRRLDANGARFSPSELHVGEKLSMLVNLIRQRTLPLYPQHTVSKPAEDNVRQKTTFVISPFSNSTIRDWPSTSYAELIKLLLARFDCSIIIVGSPKQTGQAADLMTQLQNAEAGTNVQNKVGQTKWTDIQDILRSADLVICNNSGIAHQAAGLGARTLAIYSASHQPSEWGPRGQNSRAVMMSVACSPCGYERIADCVNDHLCMRLITPAAMVAQAAAMLAL